MCLYGALFRTQWRTESFRLPLQHPLKFALWLVPPFFLKSELTTIKEMLNRWGGGHTSGATSFVIWRVVHVGRQCETYSVAPSGA